MSTSALHLLAVVFALALLQQSHGQKSIAVVTSSGITEWGVAGSFYIPLSIQLGDSVLFRWNGEHTVNWLANLTSYTTCDFLGSLQVAGISQPECGPYEHCFTWTPETTGTFYFGCAVDSHCLLGTKVAINVGTQGPSGCESYNNQTIYNGDFICYQSSSYRCESGNYLPVPGGCVPPAFISCTNYQQPCATAFSSATNQSYVYCGQNGNLTSSQTLCYTTLDAQYWCDNNRLGTGIDYIDRSENVVEFGKPCPLP